MFTPTAIGKADRLRRPPGQWLALLAGLRRRLPLLGTRHCGYQTPASVLLAHLIYGAILGTFYAMPAS
jgi:hypothetical protein